MADQRYLVTARKYRPSQFSELVAQEHVTDTLKNAIRLDRLAHAYLFSGPRGVGKTTAARILAKAINCTTPLEEREDQAEPCRECDSCQSFENGRSLNIFEIDAASNNKVDDIRELRETVRIPPQGSKKKVYIIDEVHMLSKQAFNALLKTLEEPPSHALFIFATTEPHKVLPTILSRCQRFDFRRIPVPDVVERLRAICEAEGITADEESLMLIARKGDGALRDALSAFDQAVSLCGDTIEYGELAQAMGVVDLDLFFELTDCVAAQDNAGILQLVDSIVRSGHDLQEFLSGLAEHLRNLLVAATMDNLELIEAASTTRERYASASEAFTESDLLRLLMIVDDAEDDLTSSTQPRLKLELAMLRMAAMTRSIDLRETLQKIDRLDQMAQNGELPEAMPSSATRSASEEQADAAPPDSPPAPSESDEADEADNAPPAESPSAGATTTSEPPPSYDVSGSAEADASATPSAATPEKSAAAPAAASSDDDSDVSPDDADAPTPPPVPDAAEESEESDEDEAPAPPSPATPDESADSASAPPAEGGSRTGYRDLFGTPMLEQNQSEEDDAPENSSAPPTSTDEGGAATAVATDVSTATAEAEQLHAVWGRFVRAVKQDRISLGSTLEHAAPSAMHEGTLEVAVPDDFHRRQLTEHRRLLIQHLTDVTDAPVDTLRFTVQTSSNGTSNGETPTETDPYERMRRVRREHPIIDLIFEEFGGELVW